MQRLSWCAPLFLLAGCSLPDDSANLGLPEAATDAVCRSEVAPPLPSVNMERLARTEPIAFLEAALARYDRDVRGYRVTLVKQERIRGKLDPEEHMAASFREKPFSVLLEWKQGMHQARRTLYVAGENDNQIVAQLAGWRSLAGLVTCCPHAPDARARSRYPITEFGIRMGTQRTLDFWKSARKRGELRVSFLGTKKVAELADRLCWVVQRAETPGHDPEGIVRSTYYFDAETWLQVGTELHDDQGQVVARYFFRDVELNPTFSTGTFHRSALKK